MTLLELIVAVGVLSLLLTMVALIFVGTTRSASDQRGALENSRTASTSMNEITRIVRAGTEIPVSGTSVNDPVFTYAGAEKLEMNSFIDVGTSNDPPPVRVQFARNTGNQLVETRWTAYHSPSGSTYWKFNTTSTYTRAIAQSLVATDTARPLFAYFDKDGAQLIPTAGASLTLAQIRNIASVRVHLRVQTSAGSRVAPFEVQNMVGIPNLGVARIEVN